MRKLYIHFTLAATAFFGLPAAPAVGQVQLTTLGTYTQDFDALPATTSQAAFLNNSTLTGVYAQAKLPSGYYLAGTGLVPYSGNDGAQNTQAGYYSFGNAGKPDRALGSIAANFVAGGQPQTGTGYLAIRFVNKTTRTLANLDVSYAVEQWYNSGKSTDATVSFDYQVLASTFTGQLEDGTWTAVPALAVAAPSAATQVGQRNGNAPAHRRVASTTLMGLNLAVGKEVVLRWKYVLNSATNGNGLAIDDVSVTPQAAAIVGTGARAVDNIWYYNGSGNFDALTSWVSPVNQASPKSFTADNQVFYITTRQTTVPLFNGNLISGANSKLIIGDGINPVYVRFETTKAATALMTINVAHNATLEITSVDGQLPILGTLSPGSTVHFNTARIDGVPISSPNFGNLTLSGGTMAVLTRNVSVAGKLTLAGKSLLDLANNDLTVLKGGVATSDGTAYVRTFDGGALRQTVPATGTPVLFPVGQGSYNPTWLSQGTTATEDLFGVIVSDSVFGKYVSTGIAYIDDKDEKKERDYIGYGKPDKDPAQRANHTWYVSEADLGGSNLTITLQSALPISMDPAKVTVGHYHAGAWDIDTNQRGNKTTLSAAAFEYTFTRTGIVGFSPFTLEGTATPLPVKFLAFEAKRVGNAVACTWATAAELNSDYFQVESSADGRTFQALAKVAGAGNSNTRHDYRWVDAIPSMGLAYYRLRQVDVDGTSTYSPVRTVTVDSQAPIALYPNPADQEAATLDLSALPVGDYTVQVLDLTGRQVARYTFSGAAQHLLDLQQVAPGAYVVRVQGAALSQSLLVTRK